MKNQMKPASLSSKTTIMRFAFYVLFMFTSIGFLQAQVSPGKFYQIQGKQSGKMLEVPNSKKDNGVVILQANNTGNDNQLFQFVDAGSGYYYIKAKHSNKCLDVSGVSKESGAKIHQWEQWGGENQKFALESAGGGYYFLKAKHSGKYIDISGGSRDAGAIVIQWDKHGGDNQQFKFIPQSSQGGNQPSFLVVERFTLWGDRSINVCWENPNASTSTEKGWVREAVKESWSAVTQIDFTGWGTCTTVSDGIRIFVTDDADNGPHTKGLGSELNGVRNGMVLNTKLNNWGTGWKQNFGIEEANKIIAVHEFGHAIGVAHEHNRSDCACWIEPQGTTGNRQVTPCDAESVMNYCFDGKHDRYLSALDISGIQQVYGVRTPAPKPAPPVNTVEYEVQIDACHSDLDHEGTKNRVTVAFFAGSKRVKGIYRDAPGENCTWGDHSFKHSTSEAITHVTVSTNGDDGFYIDELRIFKAGVLVNHHGRDDGSGWCLSTDPNDANGSWKGRIASNVCKSSWKFDLRSSSSPSIKYEVAIDACHSDLDHEGTNNRITVAFYAGGKRVKSIYKDKPDENCIWGDHTFSFTTKEPITHVEVLTNGDDGFYIDELRMSKNGKLIKHHGRDNGSGWCLSTDPNDANGSWKGRIASNVCKSSWRFDY